MYLYVPFDDISRSAEINSCFDFDLHLLQVGPNLHCRRDSFSYQLSFFNFVVPQDFWPPSSSRNGDDAGRW